jgi:apolipoprotein N-acyltransferase
MDVEYWGLQQHRLHGRVAPVRAAEYGLPIFRLTSSGLSQAVTGDGRVVAQAPMPGSGVLLTAHLPLAGPGTRPLDRWLAPACTGITGLVLVVLLAAARRPPRARKSQYCFASAGQIL